MGHTNLEPGLYLRAVLIDSMPFVLMGVAAVFLQVISNQKFIGYVLFILVFVLQTMLAAMHFEHNLYNLCRLAGADVLGHERLRPSAAAVGVVRDLLVRVRGDAAGDRDGVLGARHGAVVARSLAPGDADAARSAGRVARRAALSRSSRSACWIFYNTNVRERVSCRRTSSLDRQARFEKEYRKYKDLPQPRIADVHADVDIYPAERRVVDRAAAISS